MPDSPSPPSEEKDTLLPVLRLPHEPQKRKGYKKDGTPRKPMPGRPTFSGLVQRDGRTKNAPSIFRGEPIRFFMCILSAKSYDFLVEFTKDRRLSRGHVIDEIVELIRAGKVEVGKPPENQIEVDRRRRSAEVAQLEKYMLAIDNTVLGEIDLTKTHMFRPSEIKEGWRKTHVQTICSEARFRLDLPTPKVHVLPGHVTCEKCLNLIRTGQVPHSSLDHYLRNRHYNSAAREKRRADRAALLAKREEAKPRHGDDGSSPAPRRPPVRDHHRDGEG